MKETVFYVKEFDHNYYSNLRHKKKLFKNYIPFWFRLFKNVNYANNEN